MLSSWAQSRLSPQRSQMEGPAAATQWLLTIFFLTVFLDSALKG